MTPSVTDGKLFKVYCLYNISIVYKIIFSPKTFHAFEVERSDMNEAVLPPTAYEF